MGTTQHLVEPGAPVVLAPMFVAPHSRVAFEGERFGSELGSAASIVVSPRCRVTEREVSSARPVRPLSLETPCDARRAFVTVAPGKDWGLK